MRSTPRAKPKRNGPAPVFAALGEPTRLALVALLSERGPRSISELTSGRAITRQAVTKHLHVLQRAGLVRCIPRGRERIWELEARRLEDARRYLAEISTHWDAALDVLKKFVEG
jgi:DNA-binding transcriptional ArsR family regulator